MWPQGVTPLGELVETLVVVVALDLIEELAWRNSTMSMAQPSSVRKVDVVVIQPVAIVALEPVALKIVQEQVDCRFYIGHWISVCSELLGELEN